MEVDAKNDTVRFNCSGREFYMHMGIIGLAPDLSVYNGYDGPFPHEWDAAADAQHQLTSAERRELALYMIQQWRRFGVQMNETEHKDYMRGLEAERETRLVDETDFAMSLRDKLAVAACIGKGQQAEWPRRFRIAPGMEHDGDGAYGVTHYSAEDDGEWVSWDDHCKSLTAERERCKRALAEFDAWLTSTGDEPFGWAVREHFERLAAAIRNEEP